MVGAPRRGARQHESGSLLGARGGAGRAGTALGWSFVAVLGSAWALQPGEEVDRGGSEEGRTYVGCREGKGAVRLVPHSRCSERHAQVRGSRPGGDRAEPR